MTIGERIKFEREKKRMTQKELADKLGKTKNSITEIEKGRSIGQWEKLAELCDILDVSADYILGREDREDREDKEKIPRAEQWEKLRQLCDILDIPIDELTNITEKENSRDHLTAAK